MEVADLDALGPFVVMLGFIWMTIVLVVVGSMTLCAGCLLTGTDLPRPGLGLRPGDCWLDSIPFAAAVALCVAFACFLLLFRGVIVLLLLPLLALVATVVAFVVLVLVLVLVIAFSFCHLATSLLILRFFRKVHYF